MKETLLLLLLTFGGGHAAPAASPDLAATPGVATPVTGVWRGTWLASGSRVPVPVEAVLSAGQEAGTLVALVMAGVGRERRTARLSGRYDGDGGARWVLPSGGALRLSTEGGSRLVGEVKGGGPAGFVPGDGALELSRVRR